MNELDPNPNPTQLTLTQVLDDYLAAVEDGSAPDKAEWLAKYPELAKDLEDCLASLDFIRRATVDATPTDSRVAVHAENTTGQLGDYRIIREIGRGGMGVVYEAEQISLGRRVALKVLPFAAVLDAKQLQRFKNEAQAAAQLTHQNIVPVYSVGCERGVHYYAMQYIEGSTLGDVIHELRGFDESDSRAIPSAAADSDAAQLPDSPSIANGSSAALDAFAPERSTKSPAFFRSVANLGVQAAEALEHAHEFGIVHRDIKPSNLLLDQRGNLWITDFGLARLESSPDLTMTGDILGTLRYMSPEQAAGKNLLLDHRTDIYSLGVTLYELLTLRPAFDGRDRQELLKQIADQDPRPPRRLNAAIPADLETIVLKATAKEPQRRYATAKALTEDLQRFLLDKPIRAKRPTFIERASKWSRRHRHVVASSVVVLVLAVVGLSISTALIARERAEVMRQRDDAQVARRRADTNLRAARAALDEMTRITEEELTSVPRTTNIRRELLESAAQFYEHVAEQDGANPTVRLARVKAYRRLGETRSGWDPNSGAREAYEHAVRISEGLVDNFPAKPEYRHNLAASLDGLGNVLTALGQYSNAETCYRRALRLFQALVAESPGSTEHRTGLASARIHLAKRLYNSARYKEAEVHRREALALLRAIAVDRPNDPKLRRELVAGEIALAFSLVNAEAYEAGEAAVHTIINLVGSLPENHRADPSVRSCLIDAYRLLGHVLKDTPQRRDQAERALREALEISKQRVSDFPNAAAYGVNLAVCYNDLGSFLAAGRPNPQAEQAHRQAVGILDELTSEFPTVPRWQIEITTTKLRLGQQLAFSGRLEEAERLSREAVVARERLVHRFADQPYYRRPLARAYGKLSTVLGVAGRKEEAETFARKAVAVREHLMSDFPSLPVHHSGMADSLTILAVQLIDQGKAAEARPFLEKAIAHSEIAIRANPRKRVSRRLLFIQFQQLHRVLNKLGETDAAIQAARRALEVATSLAADYPDLLDNQINLIKAYGRLGKLLLDAKQLEEAEALILETTELSEKLAAKHPDQSVARAFLAVSLDHLALCHLQSDRNREARAVLLRALEISEPLVAEFPNKAWHREIDSWSRYKLAQLLANCPDPQLRDPQKAVRLAAQAVEVKPEEAAFWETLGAAHYRAGNWQEAVAALEKSTVLDTEEEEIGFNRFFLSMAHWRLGEKEQARHWFGGAIQWTKANKPDDEELGRFRAEAAELLNLETEARIEAMKTPP